VGETTAVLNGTVDPSGFQTTAWFEYGIDTGYGGRLPAPPSLGYDAGTTGITDAMGQITGLSVDTDYHFRLVAENSAGTRYGGALAFRTGSVGSSCASHLRVKKDPGQEYSTITAAVGDVQEDEAILIGPGGVDEILAVDTGAAFYIEGGWNCDFGRRTGTSSSIRGSVTITRGTVAVEGVIIE
jgi:hypothetical protein